MSAAPRGVGALCRWRLALRLLGRDWRAGELKVLATALVIAVAASTAIGFFSDRLGRGLLSQSSAFLGADLALNSPRPVPPEWSQAAAERALRTSTTLEFASVVVAGERLRLAGVKAIDSAFPLRGELRSSTEAFADEEQPGGAPQPGKAWAAPRLLQQLGLAVGDRVRVGNLELEIARVLTFEPGQATDPFGMAPRLLMHAADVPATGVVQPGSRLTYQTLFAGDAEAVNDFRAWLEPRLEDSHELVGVREGRRAVGTALERAERFLGLSVLTAIILAGVAIAMAARRYSERHYDVSAMLRCLGATQNELFALYLPQLAVLGLVAGLIGSLLGWLAQWGLMWLLADLLPVAPAGTNWWPVVGGLATGLVLLAGFALPPLLRLREVSPLRVLRRDLAPLPARAWLVYLLAGAAVIGLMWRYTGSWPLTLTVFGSGLVAAAILGMLGLALLFLARVFRGGAGVAWRFGLNNLWRRPRITASQILAFALTLMAMAVIGLVRTDLLASWQSQLPEDVPNHFAVNILPDQTEAFGSFLQRHSIATSPTYPMVRARLIGINGVPVREAVSKEEQDHNALHRELNLTWGLDLQEDNRIIDGRWFDPADAGQALVSIEAKLAEKLGIGLDDELGFSVGGIEFSARVLSLRTVQWDSFRPNFYMIFPPGFIRDLPTTHMASFRLDSERKGLLSELVREFPAVTVLELDLIIAQVERMLRQVTLAVEYILLFVLLAGFAVLFAALQASQDERLYEGALLRALGGSRRQLRSGHLAEFAALGLLAGVVAAIGTETLAWLLYTKTMRMEYSVQWELWILIPLAGALLVGAAGYWGTRPVLERSPLLLLRDH